MAPQDSKARKSAMFEQVPTHLRRTVKDSVFCDLFGRKRWLLELYRALHPEDESVREEDLTVVTLERVLTSGEYNDLGFTVGDRLVVLVEAQSTWTVNIAVRVLLYLAETFRRHIEFTDQRLHQASPIKLPVPELYVIYTGERNVPDEVSLSRDVLGSEASFIDVRIRVLKGGGADIIGQYVESARLATEIARMPESSAAKARLFVETCIERGIISEYFRHAKAEVTDIMFTLFDQEREMELYLRSVEREARERGLEQGIEQGIEQTTLKGIASLMETLGFTTEQAMDALKVPADSRASILEKL